MDRDDPLAEGGECALRLLDGLNYAASGVRIRDQQRRRGPLRLMRNAVLTDLITTRAQLETLARPARANALGSERGTVRCRKPH